MSKVLIVENDSIVAEFLEDTLLTAGYEVCGIARTAAEAITLGEQHRPELGVIDLCLSDGEYGTEVAAALRQQGRFGVLYATGNPDHPRLSRAQGEGCIAKPYLAISVLSALRIVGEKMSDRPISNFPRGFKLLGSPLAFHAA